MVGKLLRGWHSIMECPYAKKYALTFQAEVVELHLTQLLCAIIMGG